MKSVYKYELPVEAKPKIDMKGGASVLSVGVHDGKLCVWALCNTKAKDSKREFLIVGTGHDIQDEGKEKIELFRYEFVGTVLAQERKLVLHVWVHQ